METRSCAARVHSKYDQKDRIDDKRMYGSSIEVPGCEKRKKVEGQKVVSRMHCERSRDWLCERPQAVAVRYDARHGDIFVCGGGSSASSSVLRVSIDGNAVLWSMKCATV